MPLELHSKEDLCAAALAVAKALGPHTTYALVGGSACALLGSHRATEDIDFVHQLFEVEPKTNHTKCMMGKPIPIQILAPPAQFRESFDELTPVVMIRNVKVLKPSLLLNAKCGAVVERSGEDKKKSDALDILFLLRYCARNDRPLPGEVPNATKQFVDVFNCMYHVETLWTDAGYDLENGCFK
ncbi:hypothetical protein BDV25DRAFT_144225 [Aspergillus avenaceus]|uniref:Uncharacterized protein n=1 Tax=Aspergillus avenaceus TaxID=36643 RepID=A0A5N6THS9_ASPAV|nr:hypothetical protein BDV25DRAFT_144225 [Aspergillus avenaceus]